MVVVGTDPFDSDGETPLLPLNGVNPFLSELSCIKSVSRLRVIKMNKI